MPIGMNGEEVVEGDQLGARQDNHDSGSPKIDIEKFNSEEDEFEEWVELFESAVLLSTENRDQANVAFLCRKWLPLKLDKPARAALRQVTARDWPGIKAELADLLVDPEEKAKWQAKQITITWDGKESVHALAARVTTAVNKYEKHLPQALKEKSYFEHFKDAYDLPRRKTIMFNCREGNRTIEAAKEVALNFNISKFEEGRKDAQEAGAKSVTFASGTFHPDRATSIENTIAGIATQVEDLVVTYQRNEARLEATEERLGRLEHHLGFEPPQSNRNKRQREGDSRPHNQRRQQANISEWSRGPHGDSSQENDGCLRRRNGDRSSSSQAGSSWNQESRNHRQDQYDDSSEDSGDDQNNATGGEW